MPPGVRRLEGAVVYGGDEARNQHGIGVTPWAGVANLLAK
jgi:hypothetical protein